MRTSEWQWWESSELKAASQGCLTDPSSCSHWNTTHNKRRYERFKSTGTFFFFNLVNINRMSTNQSSNEDLRQNSTCIQRNTIVYFHSLTSIALTHPITNPDFFCGHGERSHPLITLGLIYRAFRADLTLIPAPYVSLYNKSSVPRFLEMHCIWRRKKDVC